MPLQVQVRSRVGTKFEMRPDLPGRFYSPNGRGTSLGIAIGIAIEFDTDSDSDTDSDRGENPSGLENRIVLPRSPGPALLLWTFRVVFP